jgi:hypothetical protein
VAYAELSSAGASSFERKNAVLDEHCAAIGRDPTTIERSVQIRFDPAALDALRDTLRSFIAAGATHLIYGTALRALLPELRTIVERE